MKEIDKKYMASYTKSHYSQTKQAFSFVCITLCTHTKLHYSQTTSLVSNIGNKLCTHTKLHYS